MNGWFDRGKKRPKYTAIVVGQEEPKPRQVVTGTMSDMRLAVPVDTIIEFSKAHLTNVDLGRQTIHYFAADASSFDHCDFSQLVMNGHLGHIPQTLYRDCDFSGADLRGARPVFARFERCSFDQTRLDDWPAASAEFVECVFVGRILRAHFSGRPLGPAREKLRGIRARNEFRGNDFRQAEPDDCSFVGGIDMDANLWPVGPRFVVLRDAQKRFATALEHIDQLADDATRERLVQMSNVYSPLLLRQLSDQRDLFLDRNFVGPALDFLLEQPVAQ